MSGVVYTGVFELDGAEWIAWALQLGLVAWILWRRPSGAPLPALSLAACALILAAGWIWRLAYGFTLMADEFGFWIGDDPFRFFRAWEWSRDPVAAFPRDPWIAGSYYLHGSAMRWMDGPAIRASKFVSAFYAVLPLLGVFMFAQAVFGRRALSALAVVLVTPSWIQVLLETGLMTELPVTGLLLAGSACLLWGLDAPPGRRRVGLHAGGALLLAAATAFHLVAWIHLAVIQGGLLVARCLRPRPARLAEWALCTAGSGAFCAFWLAVQWQMTGNPLAQLAYAGAESTPFKITDTPLRSAAIFPVALGFSLRFWLPLALLGVVRPWLRGAAPGPRGVLLGLLAVLGLLVASAVLGGTNLTPIRSVVPLASALAAYAAAALFPAAAGPSAPEAGWPRPARLAAALVVALAFAHAHHAIFAHRIDASVTWISRASGPIPGSLAAIGRWLQREIPRHAAHSGEVMPARVLAFAGFRIGWSVLAHGVGEPGWLKAARPRRPAEGMRPGQLLVSDHRLRDPGLRPVGSIGPYHVYEAISPRDRGAP